MDSLVVMILLNIRFGCHHIIHPQVNWRTTPTSTVSSSYISPLNADTHSYLSSLLFSTTMAEQTQNHKQPTRSYWRWSRQDFFPEESFQNLASYRTALLQTCLAQGPPSSRSFVKRGDPPLYYHMQLGLSALLSVLCYTEFAVEIPVAGGSFSYLRVELGDFFVFLAGTFSWRPLLVFLVSSDSGESFSDGFNLLDPIVAGGTSILNWISYVISFMVILFIIIIGFIRGKTSNLVPFFPYGARGLFSYGSCVLVLYGFNMVATMAEETKNPTKDIPLGLVGSMTMIMLCKCAYAVVFERHGMKWAKYLVSICTLKGMTTSLLIEALVLQSLFSLAWMYCLVFFIHTLLIFSLIVTLLMRRYYVKDTIVKRDLVKFLACLFVIIGSSIGIAMLWNTNKTGWIGYASFIWFLETLGMALLQATSCKCPGVPLVPGCHLCGCDEPVYCRITRLSCILEVPHLQCKNANLLFFIGLHATYDVAHQNQQA
ncbi:hypothetical protein AAG906_001069 [Vitis piasezkii]